VLRMIPPAPELGTACACGAAMTVAALSTRLASNARRLTSELLGVFMGVSPFLITNKSAASVSVFEAFKS
jgi:hypothetical protein